jgi:hypothetical protein
VSIYNTHRPSVGEGGGLYLKLEDGQTVKVRIASEPVIFESESEWGGEKSLSTRYGWLVWNQDTRQPQILQQSARFFKQIAALAQDEEWGDPKEYDIKITRQGTGTETTYNVTPSSNRTSLVSEVKQQLDKIDLIEKIKASPFAQRVMWLSDFDDKQPEQESEGQGYQKAKAIAQDIKTHKDAPQDTVAELDPSEEINLDDIPF